MIAEALIDTNVLVYAASRLPEDAAKARIANHLLQKEDIGLSAQVLAEFISVTTKKVKSPWSIDDALDWIEAFEGLPCISVDAALVRYGAELAVRHKLSYWDGAIIAAAHKLNARVVYTEDMKNGGLYGSVRAVNPFVERV
jgi:predicted nucleic acid-binding protein